MKLGGPTDNTGATQRLDRAGMMGLLLVIFVAGLASGSLGWHRLLLREIQGLMARIVTSANRDQLPAMALDITYADYSVLLAQREVAQDSGVHITSADGFVPAVMRLDGNAVETQIQLREGPADSFGIDDKWPFEVHVTSIPLPEVLPFDQFHLQDPAENNWLMQWAFTEALQQEGLLTARYRFVRLTLNGKDQGIYAVQEGFGDTLLPAQGQPAGVIIGFDTDRFWTAIAHFGGSRDAALADPVSNLSGRDLRSFDIDVSQYETIVDSPDLEAQTNKAISLLYALQTGQRRPSEVFDPAIYGRFLALIDLWGAAEATSLLNLRYYYDASSETLQPISSNANALGSDERLALAATYEDPVLQMAYVQEAIRISQPDYLKAVKASLTPTWQRLSAAIQEELQDPVPPWDELEERQTALRQSLHPIQPILAHVVASSAPDYKTLDIDVANILNLPVEVLGFDIAGATFVDVTEAQIASTSELLPDLGTGIILRSAGRAKSEAVRYTRFKLSLEALRYVDEEATFEQDPGISVAVRLLGATDAQLVPATTDLPQPPSSGAVP